MNKNNSGALFKEEEKKSDKHPDYKGNCLVNGKQMYIAAWINTSQGGKKYMSLSFSEPKVEYSKQDSNATPTPQFTEPSAKEDIPF